MRRWKIFIPVLSLFLVWLVDDPSALAAQIFGFWRGPVIQNNPPPTDFIVARLRYSNNRRIGGMGWAHNYPEGEMHLNEFIRNVTKIDVEIPSYRIVNLVSDEIFQYPFAIVSEPGEIERKGSREPARIHRSRRLRGDR
jgi:Domain of unknown function (DUF4159)